MKVFSLFSRKNLENSNVNEDKQPLTPTTGVGIVVFSVYRHSRAFPLKFTTVLTLSSLYKSPFWNWMAEGK